MPVLPVRTVTRGAITISLLRHTYGATDSWTVAISDTSRFRFLIGGIRDEVTARAKANAAWRVAADLTDAYAVRSAVTAGITRFRAVR